VAHLIIVDSPSPSIVFTDVSTTSVDGSGTLNFTGLSFGAENPTRRIIAVLGWIRGTGGSLSTCTIGGVSANLAVRGTGFNSNSFSDIWIADVPTGTSGTVALSGVSGNWAAYCAVYQALHLRSNAPVSTDSDGNGALSMSVGVPSRGIVVATARVAAFGSVGTNSWSGIPRDFNQTFNSNNAALVGGSNTYPSASTASVAISWSNASDDVGSMASFR